MAKQISVDLNQPVKAQAPAKRTPKVTMKDYIQKYEGQIAKALPSVITPERFTRMAINAVAMNPDLGACTPASFIGAMMQAAQLGLEPNTPLGQAYLIPYNRNFKDESGAWHQVKEAQLQIGYKGLIDLAHRSGEFKSIEAHVVYENDEFEYELGLEPKLKHKPAMKDRGEIVWVYAIYKLQSGGYGFEVMSKEDIDKHRQKYSKSKTGPWADAWESMAKKTCIKQALKYAPLKSEFVRGMQAEEVTMNFRDDFRDPEDALVSDESSRYDADTGEIIEAEYKEVTEEVK